jgi:hypothetical protein
VAEAAAWAGSVREFLSLDSRRLLGALDTHHRESLGLEPARSQREAWREEVEIVSAALRSCCTARPAATEWGVVFEFELPLEGGRRPDVVVLAGANLFVLEFKSGATVERGDVDQVAAYARDLADYHEASHGRSIYPILVLAGAKDLANVREEDGVVVSGPLALARYLDHHAGEGSIDLTGWLAAPYAPLPTLVEAARRIFAHEPLPHVRTALAAGIPEAVDLLASLVTAAEQERARLLAFVTGVPGAGKTLVGLRLVYEKSGQEGKATFLSGNGPLVQVLQDALQSKVFVRDLHAFVKTHGIGNRVAKQHVIVFDEAQRAWDVDFMKAKKDVASSEPQLLIRAGERIAEWAILVGLIGEGQEIFSGEEAGMPQWREAVSPPSATLDWRVHCPPHVAPSFEGLCVTAHAALSLTETIRSRRAQALHNWVARLVTGSLAMAARLAVEVHRDQFPLYLTRELEAAKDYARSRYQGEDVKRYGLIASSHAKNLLAHGVDNGFQTTKQVKIAQWFNRPPSDPACCCALTTVVTEFQCQGLELDLPIVCWGTDLTWAESRWKLRPIRRKHPQRDPERVLRNVYRVLLTRGRDGLVIWIPPDPELDGTELALLAAGVRPLPERMELAVSA